MNETVPSPPPLDDRAAPVLADAEVERWFEQEAAIARLALVHRLLTPADAVRILDRARRMNLPPGTLLSLGVASPKAALAAIADDLDLEFVDLDSADWPYRLDLTVAAQADLEWLLKLRAVPMVDHREEVVVLAADPNDAQLVDYVRATFGPEVRLVLAASPSIEQMLVTEVAAAQSSKMGAALGAGSRDLQVRDPVVEWIDELLQRAVVSRASDIHLQLKQEGGMLLRFRVDGVMLPQPPPPRGREGQVLGSVMSRSGMDASNTREPADGGFEFAAAGRRIDVRASMVPTDTGPRLVLRLLDGKNNQAGLDALGFSDGAVRAIRDALTRTQGTIICAGPTGSGKTTTLYAGVREVASMDNNVMTVEDPVEYRLPLVSQIPIRSGLGDRSVTFARALRSVLRQDPDVVLVGEIRDTETAKTAMDAAITGHLVLTTVHAQSAPGVYTRLTEMGVPGYMVSEAVTLSIAQRLVRRLHDECARAVDTPPQLRDRIEQAVAAEVPTIREPGGCHACNGTGFFGRLVVSELLRTSEPVRRAVVAEASNEDIRRAAPQLKDVPATMADDTLRHVAAGRTGISEFARILNSAT